MCAGETRAKLRAHADSGIRAGYAVHTLDQHLFVYQDNAQKRAQYEDLYQQIFYLSHADVGEVSQILNHMLTPTTAGRSPSRMWSSGE